MAMVGNVFNIRNRPVYVKEAAGGQQQDKAGSWAAAGRLNDVRLC